MQPDLRYAPESAYHQQRRWTQPSTVRCLEAAVVRLGPPSSFLDVGCAEGVTVRWAQEHLIDAMGIDLAAPEDPAFVRADLREPIDLGRTFDWVLCWEVAEHLPESAADVLCQTIVRHLAPEGRVLFTAARPGQRGPGHCNCQQPVYWLHKFAALGVFPDPTTTLELVEAWQQCAPKTPWYARNLLVLDRGPQ